MQAGAVNIKLMADIADLQAKMREVEKLMGASADSFEKTQRAAEQMSRSMNSVNAAGLSAVSKQMDRVGLSAAQAAYAMRMIPMQMTDVVTSLSSGMSPMQVLIQQGGQIKDAFGSVGAAFRGVGQYLVGLVNPVTAVVAAIVAVGVAVQQTAREQEELRKAIALTGNAAGVSVDQLNAMAERMGEGFGRTAGAAADALAIMVNTGQVGRASLQQYAETAMLMEQKFGISIEKTAEHFAELGKDPVGASKRLNENMNYLTAATYKQIAAAIDMGDKTRAATLAQEAFDTAIKASATNLDANLGYVEKGWKKILDGVASTWKAMKEVWDWIKSIGREDPLEVQVKKLQAELSLVDEGLRNVSSRQKAAMQDQLSYLQESVRMQKRAGDAALERAAQETAGIELVDRKRKEQEEAKRKAQAATDAAARAQQQLVESGVKLYGDLTAKEFGLAGDFAEKWEQLAAAYRAGKLSLEQLTQAQAELLAQQPAMVKQTEEARKAAEARQTAVLREADAIEKLMQADAQAAVAAVSAINARTTGMTNELEAQRLAIRANVSLAEAVEMVALARLQEKKALLREDGTAYEAVQREIEARERLLGIIKDKAAFDATQKAAQEAASEWKRTADEINRSLTDALMRGFESGKGFGKNLRDTIVNLFKTMVLRPIVQPIVSGLTGMLGLSGAPAIAGQAGGVLENSTSLLGIGDTISKVYTTVTSGFEKIGVAVGDSAVEIGNWLMRNTTGVLNSAGEAIASNAVAIGNFASTASGVLAGYSIGKMISGQYSTGLGKNTLELAGTAIGAIFGGPIGAAIGGAIGGVVNRAFGMGAKSVTGEGISGTFSADSGASVQSYSTWFQKGGWFRSNKSGTNYASVSTELDDFLDAAIMMTARATREYAQVVGLSADAISGFSKAINVSLLGLDQAGREKAIAAAISGFGDDLATLVMGEAGKALQRQGETAAAALVRLATALGSVNDVLKSLGQNLLGSSLAGASSAQALLDLFGGMDAYAQAAGQYLQAFYTDAERISMAQDKLAEAMSALGLATPDSIAAYRALVEAQDLAEEGGRATYVALLKLAPAFAELNAALTGTAETVTMATDGIFDEIGRLRRLLVPAGTGTMASLQADFAMTTAAARAGDQSALNRLPSISQALESAAALQAVTAADLARMRGQLSANLEATLQALGIQVPQFDIGTNFVPRDMLAVVHEGEAIVPRAYNPAAGGTASADTSRMEAQIERLAAELQGLRAEVRAGVAHTAKTARILERVTDATGTAINTIAETA